MEASFFSKPLQTTQPIRMQGQQKFLPPAGEEGHSSMRMHDNNTTCNISNQNAGFLDTTNTTGNRSNQNESLPDTHSCSTNQHPAAPDTTKPCVTEARHNAEKHFLLVNIMNDVKIHWQI